MSRRHCRLERQGDKVVLTDLGSTNGTYRQRRTDRSANSPGGWRPHHDRCHTISYHRRCPAGNGGMGCAGSRTGARRTTTCCRSCRRRSSHGPVLAEWHYQPCTRLGGDAFGYQMLDTRCFAAYMLDVAGHGAGSALFSVTVANVLRQRMLPEVDFRDPAAGDPRPQPHVSDGAAQQSVLHDVVWRVRHSRAHVELRAPPATTQPFCWPPARASRCRSEPAIPRSASQRTVKLMPHGSPWRREFAVPVQ